MVLVHLIYDLTQIYGILPWGESPLFLLVRNWGGLAFFLLSGICATLGSRERKRGALVFGCGLLVSVVTDVFSPQTPIRFGVLHCLGLCMIFWHPLKGLTSPVLIAVSVPLILMGLVFQNIHVQTPRLFPLGLTAPDFFSADYFPLLPFLGFFLLVAVLGRRLYRQRQSLLPQVNTRNPIIRFLLLCGRHSLIIYLLHQPLLMIAIETIL